MREVNFSIPSANKASVGITTALYDRRALDCTSRLPLVNSLNHLAYLTTSSARIREILTIDGGVERLICILKNGRSKDMMDTWLWNLAYQCVVNIGVRGSDARATDNRGSETVRTRVVEADVVPVLATILDNYIKVLEQSRTKQDELGSTSDSTRQGSSRRSSNDANRLGASSSRSDRRRPAPIDTSLTNAPTFADSSRSFLNVPEHAQPSPVPSPLLLERPTLGSHRNHHHHHHHHVRPQTFRQEDDTAASPAQQAAAAQLNTPIEPFARPRNPLLSRDGFAMPPMTPPGTGEANSSRPDTPTTPIARVLQTRRRSASAPYPVVSSLAQDLSMSGDSDEDLTGQLPEIIEAGPSRLDPMVGFQDDMIMADIVDRATLMDTVQVDELPAPDVTGDADAETFNITHRSMDGSLIDPVAAPPNPAMNLSPVPATFGVQDGLQLPSQPPYNQSLSPERTSTSGILASVPRDEDVIMALQLLAYVSKYPSLRPYFQQTHFVPKLRINLAADGSESAPEEETDKDEEYCQPDDYNIFPLVEKFTVRYQHTADVTYWAVVVMRNLCRKDKGRGDIRQCAYYKCGEWEKYARQFAKCRQCRQTKYCSKECQKSAWVYHRHWCEPADADKDKRRGHTCVPPGEHA